MEQVNRTTLGNNITDLRNAHNETQADLADILELKHHQQISFFENGKRDVSLDQLVTIAKHYHVSTDFLLGLYEMPDTTLEDDYIAEYIGCTVKSLAAIKSLFCIDKDIKFLNDTEQKNYKLLFDLATEQFLYSLSDDFYRKPFIKLVEDSIFASMAYECFDDIPKFAGISMIQEIIERNADLSKHKLIQRIPEIIDDCVSELRENYDIDFNIGGDNGNGWKLKDTITESICADELGISFLDPFSYVYHEIRRTRENVSSNQNSQLIIEELRSELMEKEKEISSLNRMIIDSSTKMMIDLSKAKETDDAEEK